MAQKNANNTANATLNQGNNDDERNENLPPLEDIPQSRDFNDNAYQ